MFFVNGDNPFLKFEDGVQKGRHFGCCGCGGDMRRVGEYDYMYMAHQKYRALQVKQTLENCIQKESLENLMLLVPLNPLVLTSSRTN